MIIGAPKAIHEFPKLKKEEVEALAKTLNELLNQGAPPEAQMGVPLGSLAQLVHTALDAFPVEVDAAPPTEERPRLIIPPV